MPPEKDSQNTETDIDLEDGTEGSEENNVEDPEDPSEGEEEGSEDNEDDELSEEDAKEAKSLYKYLRNPQTRVEALKALAQQAGINLTPETKAEEKKTRKAIADLVAEHLGPEFQTFGSRLSKALEAILDQQEQSYEERVNQRISQFEAAQVQKEVNSILSQLHKETRGESKKLEGKMMQLMDKFQQGPNVSLEEYIRGLYAQASAGSQKAKMTNKITDKIRRNASDAPNRIKTASKGNAPMKKMSLDEAARFGMAQLTKED